MAWAAAVRASLPARPWVASLTSVTEYVKGFETKGF